MNPVNVKSTTATLLVVLISITLGSFASVPGGYSYELYVNNQLVIKEHMYGRKEAPSIPLNMTTAQDELSIMFNNCNKVDTQRKISLRDEQEKLLKEWTFEDSPDLKNQMRIKVSEITAFKDQYSTAKLVYSSREASSGVHLVNLQFNNATAKKK